jgi:PmbA protein
MQPLNKERLTLEDAANKLLGMALKSGAEEAEVCATYSIKTKVSLEKQDFHMATSDDAFQLGIRVLSGHRQGFSSCNSTDTKDLKEAAQRAVEISGFSPVNPHNAILGSENIRREAPSELWDDHLFHLSLKTQKDWTKILAEESMRDSRFRLNDGSVGISAGLYLILNSQGTHKIEKETAVSWTVMGMGVDGDKITSFDYFQHLQRAAAGVPDQIVATSKFFREQVLANLNQGSTKSYHGLVIFSPRAVIDVLLSGISSHINGRSVAEGTSKWSLEKLNQKVLNSSLTLKDKPWLTDRTGCSVFDREGNPTQETSIIENGNLRQILLDSYAAKALNLKTTGHAAGGPTVTPSVSAHCLCLTGGNEKKADLVGRASQLQNEILLVHRFSGRTDPITGDFSGVAKGGEWWHNGERVYFVRETLISGNVFEALGKDLFGISAETEVVDCSEESPTLVAGNISVTGG